MVDLVVNQRKRLKLIIIHESMNMIEVIFNRLIINKKKSNNNFFNC